MTDSDAMSGGPEPTGTVSRAQAEAFYGADGLVRVPADRLPAAVSDPGARAFLTEVGLPRTPVSVFTADDRVPDGMIRLADYYLPRSFAEVFTKLPAGCGEWLVLGDYVENVFALDGATGAVHAVGSHAADPEQLLRPAHRDLNSLVRCLMAVKPVLLRCMDLEEEQEEWCADHFPGWADLDEETMAGIDLADLVADLIADLQAVEPELLSHPTWLDILHDFGYEG